LGKGCSSSRGPLAPDCSKFRRVPLHLKPSKLTVTNRECLLLGQDSQRLDAGTFYHPLEENLCPSPTRTARCRTRKFLKLDCNYPVLYRVRTSSELDFNLFLPTSRPLHPRGYHFLLRRRKPWWVSLPWQPSFRRNWFARKNRSQVLGSRFPLTRACFRIFGTSLPPFDWMLSNSTGPSGGMHCTP